MIIRDRGQFWGKVRIKIIGVRFSFGGNGKIRIRIIGFRFRFLVRVGSRLGL